MLILCLLILCLLKPVPCASVRAWRERAPRVASLAAERLSTDYNFEASSEQLDVRDEPLCSEVKPSSPPTPTPLARTTGYWFSGGDWYHGRHYPASIYMFRVINRNFRAKCEICSKLKIKTPERRQQRHWRLSGVFIVKTFNIFHTLF